MFLRLIAVLGNVTHYIILIAEDYLTQFRKLSDLLVKCSYVTIGL